MTALHVSIHTSLKSYAFAVATISTLWYISTRFNLLMPISTECPISCCSHAISSHNFKHGYKLRQPVCIFYARL